MAQITAYLFFEGNCREAMTFYKECLGGTLHLQAVADTPAAAQMAAGDAQKILHAALNNGSLDLMASDWMGNEVFVKGNSMSLSIHCGSEEEINSLFGKLSVGGKVKQPLADQFWGATFGMLTDKFGIDWMLNYAKPK
jgi:PhnB protein